MSDIKTSYALFDVEDYRGLTLSAGMLSTYNLPITPLIFKAKIPTQTADKTVTLNNTKITYDFGDGTTSTDLTSTHVFQFPGTYTVKIILRDCHNNAILGSYSTAIDIKDYIINTFTVEFSDYNFTLSAGEFSSPLTINSHSPFYQDFQDIYFSVSGCNWPNYFNLNKFKFNHLEGYNSFYKREFLPNLSGFQYVDVKKITLSSENIYVRLDGTELVSSTTDSMSSILAGSSGTEVIYFKTEEQTPALNISFYKDRKNIFSRTSDTKYGVNDFNNNFTVALSSAVGDTSLQTPSALSITSNGLDGESDEVNSFNINSVQYKGVGVPFILKPKNNGNYTMKALSAGDPELILVYRYSTTTAGGSQGSGDINPDYYTITNLNDTLSSIGTDFWYRGVLTFNDSTVAASSGEMTNVTLSAKNAYLLESSSTETTLSGTVDMSFYPKHYYSLNKVNENFNFEQTIKDLRFQEILLDKNIFFTDFIGSIFGSASARHTALGKKIYESIINFVQNTSDIDVCSINALDGLSILVDNSNLRFDRAGIAQPAEIKRIIDLLSVKYNKFRGMKNTFDENFDSRGHVTKAKYGKNLGPEITFETHVLSAGTPIVAYEKFSGVYTKLNTWQPISAATVNQDPGVFPFEPPGVPTFLAGRAPTIQYSLSAYDDAWGWPLVLAPGWKDISSLSAKNITAFYTFYEFALSGSSQGVLSGVPDDGIYGALIDWSNPQTGNPINALGMPSWGAINLTQETGLSELDGDNNIFDIMIRDTLFSSLSLF
tara:strand:+ start:3285 stop:5597 length:2313 start_codon:yes stop_codon:yes gene_type:complete